jgi:hypothetical protein
LIVSENGSEGVPSVVADKADSSAFSAVSMVEVAETSPLVAEVAGSAAPVAIEAGFVDNVGVLCWDDGERRAYAAEAELLYAALGPDWRGQLRQTAMLKFGYR